MAHVYMIESGVRTTTEATRRFFKEVKYFLVSMNPKTGIVTFRDLRNLDRKLCTSPVRNMNEINRLRAENGGKYVRIQTHNSVINICYAS